MSLTKKYGQLALVAGASEGIGAAFSEYLAKEGFDLVLVARRMEPLESLASSLKAKYNISVETACCDLSDLNAAEEIIERVSHREIDLLAYNAALSYIGKFEENSIDHHYRIATTNMVTPMKMVQLLGEPMLQRGRGAIILMASLAGFQGSGFLAGYAASKAFTRVLAESLWYEWKERGVDVIACCAGATSTKNYLDTNPGKTGFLAPSVIRPDKVVIECMKRLGRNPSYITGRGNRIASFIMQRVFPRKTAIKIMGDTTRKMYRI